MIDFVSSPEPRSWQRWAWSAWGGRGRRERCPPSRSPPAPWTWADRENMSNQGTKYCLKSSPPPPKKDSPFLAIFLLKHLSFLYFIANAYLFPCKFNFLYFFSFFILCSFTISSNVISWHVGVGAGVHIEGKKKPLVKSFDSKREERPLTHAIKERLQLILM